MYRTYIYIYLLTSWCQLWGKWLVNVDGYTPLDREITDPIARLAMDIRKMRRWWNIAIKRKAWDICSTFFCNMWWVKIANCSKPMQTLWHQTCFNMLMMSIHIEEPTAASKPTSLLGWDRVCCCLVVRILKIPATPFRWPPRPNVSKCQTPRSWESALNHGNLCLACSMKEKGERWWRNVAWGDPTIPNLFLTFFHVSIYITRWWFQIFFIFTRIEGRFPIWIIFFRWVETTNQINVVEYSLAGSSRWSA